MTILNNTNEVFDFYKSYKLLLDKEFYLNKTHAYYTFKHSAIIIALANCYRLADDILTLNKFTVSKTPIIFLKFKNAITKLWSKNKVINNPTFPEKESNKEFLNWFLEQLKMELSYKIYINYEKCESVVMKNYLKSYSNITNNTSSIIDYLFNITLKADNDFVFLNYLELNTNSISEESLKKELGDRLWNCPEYLILSGDFENFPLKNLHLENYIQKSKGDLNNYIYDCSSIIYKDGSVLFNTEYDNWYLHKTGKDSGIIKIDYINGALKNSNIYNDVEIIFYNRKFII